LNDARLRSGDARMQVRGVDKTDFFHQHQPLEPGRSEFARSLDADHFGAGRSDLDRVVKGRAPDGADIAAAAAIGEEGSRCPSQNGTVIAWYSKCSDVIVPSLRRCGAR